MYDKYYLGYETQYEFERRMYVKAETAKAEAEEHEAKRIDAAYRL